MNQDEPATYSEPGRQREHGDALIGATIDNRYRIESKIGQGGMGCVYLASRLLIGDKVAIKVLHAEQVKDPQAVERFRREAQAAARLKHPNVVTIHDFGVSSEGLVFLVMELVEGESLRSVIKRQGPLAPSVAAAILKQVCAALDEAHRRHVVHRDLKPDNILVLDSANGLEVKVLDFGIAKMRDLSMQGDLTQTGTLMGTPYYMSPEQCKGEELDGRSDIYSLGIVLYEMLTGSVPFSAATTTAVVLQHVTAQPPPLSQHNASISPAIERVVMDALEKDRGMRPQTAGALAMEMTDAVTGSRNYSAAAAPFVTDPSHYGDSSSRAAKDLAPTVQIGTSNWRSGPTTPAGVSAPIGSPVAKASGRKLIPIIIAIVVLMAVAAGAAMLLIRTGDKAKTETEEKAATPTEDLQKNTTNPAQPEQQAQVDEKSLIESERSMQRGLDNANQKNYSLAVKELSRSVELNPRNVIAWANLATAHLYLNQFDQAQVACAKALDLDSNNWLAHYNLGSLHARRGNNDEAITELSESLRLVAQNQPQGVTESQLKQEMRTDRMLNSLRGDARFKQLVAK